MSDLRATISGTSATPPAPRGAPDLARDLIARTSIGGRPDATAINAQLADIARRDPALAARTRAEIETALPPLERGNLARTEQVAGSLPDGTPVTFAQNGVEQGRWIEHLRTSSVQGDQALYAGLVQAAGSSDSAAIKAVLADAYNRGLTPEMGARPAPANSNEPGWQERLAKAMDGINPVNRIADLIQPAIADLGRSAGLGNTEWGGRLQALLDQPGTAAAFRQGVTQGIIEGGESLVTGVVGLAGKTLQYGADNSLLGDGGDLLRGVTGQLPGWADAALPSARRGDESSAALREMGGRIGDYVSSRAGSPSLIREDAVRAFDSVWQSVKGDHAAAAAQGPLAEAQWFGRVMGSATFEVGSSFVPVAGWVGKADKVADGARAADALGDGVRAADSATDTARATEGAGELGAARAASLAGRTLDGAFGPNTARWTFDGEGRLVSASADLRQVFSGLTRSSGETAAQREVAARGITGDHGGHAIPHRFISDQGAINMFPQNGVAVGELKNFNGSAFKTLENELADWVGAGGRVEYDIRFSNFDGQRPGTVGVNYRVFDADGNQVFSNADRFRNEAGQTFERVSRSEIETILRGER